MQAVFSKLSSYNEILNYKIPHIIAFFLYSPTLIISIVKHYAKDIYELCYLHLQQTTTTMRGLFILTTREVSTSYY